MEMSLGSIETQVQPCDKYGIEHFAQDNPKLFLELVEYLNPRDAEILLCYAYLQKRPTDLSILFGKAGHRAEEDLHKAAHKLAGLIEFGPEPPLERLQTILGAEQFAKRDFAACIWQYARCRDFAEMARLCGQPGLRAAMMRLCKKLHAMNSRDEGLLAGWLLWLVDGSNPNGKGWMKRKRCGRENKLGPTVFRTFKQEIGIKSNAHDGYLLNPRATKHSPSGKGGMHAVKIQRKMKFFLRVKNG